jgi:hypothetical protein
LFSDLPGRAYTRNVVYVGVGANYWAFEELAWSNHVERKRWEPSLRQAPIYF